MENNIRGIFSKSLITIEESGTIAEANAIMEKCNIRHLPVLDAEGYLVGMISKNDFRALLRMKASLKDVSVKSLMSSPVTTFSSNALIRAVAQAFVARKINSGLVMQDNEIVGIVTSEDLLRVFAASSMLDAETEKMDLADLAGEGWISATSLR